LKHFVRWTPVFCLLALLGCRGESVPKEPIKLGQLPATVVKTVQKRLPDLSIVAASKEKVRGKQIYEVQGKDKAGKSHKIEVSSTGDVLKVD
jgi:hypothetical protein